MLLREVEMVFGWTCLLGVKCKDSEDLVSLCTILPMLLSVLDERTDRRVDEMVERGLVEELSQFHQCYNQQRLGDDR